MSITSKDVILDEKETVRFWGKVNKTSGDGCWEWSGSKRSPKPERAYGSFHYRGKNIYAHRLSYMNSFGEIPNGMEICHRCDNPSCVNPDHLFVGSHLENMRDCFSKGRRPSSPYCKRGHSFTPENIKTRKNGSRRCLECLRQEQFRSRIKNRGQKAHVAAANGKSLCKKKTKYIFRFAEAINKVTCHWCRIRLLMPATRDERRAGKALSALEEIRSEQP